MGTATYVRAPPSLAALLEKKLPVARGVGEMNHLLRARQLFECASSSGLKRSALLDEVGERLWDVELCRRAKDAVTIVEHDAKLGFTDAGCVLQHGPEDRL